MLFIVIVGTLAVVTAVLGLSICRVAALSDCNSDPVLAEWIAGGQPVDRNRAPIDPAGQQSLFAPPSDAFRKAG
jgi:hypothetical protein